MTALLVDIGNSRIKGAFFDGENLFELAPIDTTSFPVIDDWEKLLSKRARPKQVLVSNVAGPTVAEGFVRAALKRWRVKPEFVCPRRECAGVTTRYEEPTQLGVDRWLSALAAYQLSGSAVCVLDAGTALTIDVVRQTGEHLGGLIAPGPGLMRLSLARQTAQLDVKEGEELTGFGINSRDAIGLGCDEMVRGLLSSVERRLIEVAPGEIFRWYLTGGGADTIKHLLHVDYDHTADLVLRGLALIANMRR